MEKKQNFNTVSMILGSRNHGKTKYLKGDPELNLPGFFSAYLAKGMKVLIIDTFDHPSYKDIPILKVTELSRFKRGVYRIFVNPDDMPALNTFINTLVNLWNTLIVYEDAYKHQDKTLDKPIKQLIIDSKQKNIDLIFIYHAWAMAPVALYKMIDLIEVFKTKDHPKSRRDDMPGYYEDAVKIYEEVKKNASPYFHKLLNTEL